MSATPKGTEVPAGLREQLRAAAAHHNPFALIESPVPLARRRLSELLADRAADIEAFEGFRFLAHLPPGSPDPGPSNLPLATELRRRAVLLEQLAKGAAQRCGSPSEEIHRMGCACDFLRALGEMLT